jgi:nucleotide-binding universal stress UspA family protein
MTSRNDRYVILTALQFDETGDLALQEAVRIAERTAHAELHVLHVCGPSLAAELNGDAVHLALQLKRSPEILHERVNRAFVALHCSVSEHLRVGLPVDEVLQAAADIDADLIVLGTHHRTGIGRLVLGSVAERVMREAHCPVLIAIPKSYDRQAAANVIEPPCPECLALRSAEHDPNAWCERHSRTRLRPHVYTPSGRPRSSALGN